MNLMTGTQLEDKHVLPLSSFQPLGFVTAGFFAVKNKIDSPYKIDQWFEDFSSVILYATSFLFPQEKEVTALPFIL